MNNLNNDELYHYGILGMKWGVRRTPEQLGYSKSDSSVTKRVKKDYNSMSDSEFKKKYYMTKRAYSKRVEKYGDPYMKSPFAKIGKGLSANEKSKKEAKETKIVNKAMKKVNAINKDIKSFESIKNGLKDKKGRLILTEQDVANSVKALNELKLNTIAKTDKYKKGLEESKKVMNDLSRQYSIAYDVGTGKYTLSDKK